MMSSSGSEEKTKTNSVSETFNEYPAYVKPTDPSFISNTGCIFRDIMKDYDNAITAFSKVIELEPGQMAAYGHRGDAYLKKNDYDNAFQDFTRVIESNPESKQLPLIEIPGESKMGWFSPETAEVTHDPP